MTADTGKLADSSSAALRSDNHGAAPPRSNNDGAAAYRSLVGVGIACAVLIVSVRAFTQPRISELRALARESAVLSVLPDSVSSRAFEPTAQGGFRSVQPGAMGEGRDLLHAGYNASGRFVGVALSARGMGYQDVIQVLYGYDPARDLIVGMSVLDSRETPGLGDRIGKDPGFLANFAALDVSLTDSGELRHPIESVPAGKKTSAWQVDAITGATVSSRAVTSIVRDSASRWLPRVKRHLEDFRP